jgi:hypothetical protein
VAVSELAVAETELAVAETEHAGSGTAALNFRPAELGSV